MSDAQSMREFLFERSFADDVQAAAKHKKIEPTFSKDELEHTKEESYQKGIKDGQLAAHNSIEQQKLILLNQMSARLDDLMQAGSSAWTKQNDEMQAIAIMIARKILPTFIQKNGIDEITNLIDTISTSLAREPRLVVHVANTQEIDVQKQLDILTKEKAYQGQIVLIPHDDMQPSDCRLEWSEGGIERNLRDVWRQLDKILLSLPSIEADFENLDELEEMDKEEQAAQESESVLSAPQEVEMLEEPTKPDLSPEDSPSLESDESSTDTQEPAEEAPPVETADDFSDPSQPPSGTREAGE